MRSSSLLIASSLLAVAVATPVSAQNPMWVYSVPFVCGLQNPITSGGEPVVKPGNYATEIDIHNPQEMSTSGVDIRKKFILLVDQGQVLGREPAQRGPAAFDGITLGPDFATMDDCFRIWTLTHPGVIPPTPMPLMKGYVILITKEQIDVDAIYTAIVPGTSATTAITGNSIDVERIEGKQVLFPLTGASVPDTIDPQR